MPATVRFVRALTGHSSAIYALHPTRDPAVVLAGSGDGLVVRWQLDRSDNDQQPAGLALVRVPANVFSLCLLPDQRHLLVGGLHGGVHLVDLGPGGVFATAPADQGTGQAENTSGGSSGGSGSSSSPSGNGREIRNLGNNKSAVHALSYRSTSQRLWVGHGDGIVTVWDTRDWSPVWRRSVARERIRALAPEPGQGGRMAAAASDGTVYLLDEDTGSVIQRLDHGESSVFSLAWHPQGNMLLTGAMDAHLRCWEGKDEAMRLREAIPAHLFTINAIAFSPTGSHFATGSRDKTIKVWESDLLGLIKVVERPKFPGHAHSVNALQWGPSGLLSASDDRDLRLWELEHS